MASRAFAASFLLVSAAVAWITITVPLAARVLQAGVLLSMLYVAYLAWRGSRVMRAALRGMAAAEEAPRPPLRRVTLVVPARNEAVVIGETVASLARLEYATPDGAPAYMILVVDDGSVDGTGERATAAAAASAAGGQVSVVRREPEDGPRTKGAVLRYAADHVGGEVIGVVDADTRVDPGFLRLVMRAWDRDPGAAAIQVSRRPRNADRGWLTGAQAEEQLMDMASQCGRRATDGTAELRGNGMFVRRDVLEQVGGWNPAALTEDLDLSTRLAAAGHRVALAPEAAVEEEAVESLDALWHQRLRWAEGSLRRLLEHGPGLLAGPLSPGHKADFLVFAAEFLLPPLFATTIIASLLTIPLPRPADWTVPASLFAGYGLGVFLLALGGLSAAGVRGPALVGRGVRGALFLSHWLVVVPVALARIAFGATPTGFVQTPRFTAGRDG
jgi:1,2-diacylglycerol 3-beta-glucosyltransferase